MVLNKILNDYCLVLNKIVLLLKLPFDIIVTKEINKKPIMILDVEC